MIINRHNYEEFFILYWDNELTPDDKKQVEVFVQENADLQEEFSLFGETRFMPEATILFDKKELLLSNKNSFINFSNYPERFLSYIDDELTKTERTEVEKFADKHPAVQQELSLLLKTKLQPETEIVFRDKSVLYRKEEKVRIVVMNRRRLAVAAIVLLMAGLVTFRLINNNTKQDGQPEIVNVIPPKENKAVENIPAEVLALQNSKQPDQKDITDKKIKKPLIETPVNENLLAIEKENKNNLPEEKKTSNQSLIAVTNTNRQPDESDFPEFKKATNDAVLVAQAEKKDDLFDDAAVTKSTAPAFLIYNQPTDDKGGLKGFLRKATRVFEHRTNIKTTTDDNKLLVGVFAVSLK